MASFANTLAADLTAIFAAAEFSETVSYTVAGGTAKNVSAIVERDGDLSYIFQAAGLVGLPVTRELRVDFAGGATADTAVVWLRQSDAPAAGYGDSLTFAGATWTVRPVWREV